MNELLLSNDLPQIEFEINHYQKQAGESIFEIGRRLKHVKENDLVHGEFGKWLAKVNMNDSQARKFIKISDEFSNRSTSNSLGVEALYQIATLPEPERTKEHITTKGEIKTPDEMTVRELRELKKQLKERDEQTQQLQTRLEQSQRSEQIALNRLEEVEDREPQVIEKVKEVVPAHLKAQLSDKETELISNRQRIVELEKELGKLKIKKENVDEDEILGSRRFQAESHVLDLKENIDSFLSENAVNAFKEGAIATSSQRTKDLLQQGVEELENFCRAMRTSLKNQITIN
ncbi:DUF3102 domain-containing protein [Macrococcus brunensis]|uniref:DUF3102 domain-containing protein n=1 Tax=Macrococcus brunensis TaxID=198483 RepID=UPI001EEFACC4|nr:DUF3102 domain-containing protein [Macrococcus brunensis]ULG73182.1 DUF3102 domain-containing protein [Macrococcus brunensis]